MPFRSGQSVRPTFPMPERWTPLLNSDLAGTTAEYYQPGYYRTAHNDLYQGEAVSAFLHDSLGPQKVAVVHEGDAYTQGLAQAFSDAFKRHGGTVTDFVDINPDTTDLAGGADPDRDP